LINRINDPKLAKIKTRLEAVEKTFPAEDTSPRYTPLAPQAWDHVQKNPGRQPGLTGLPSNAPKKKRGKN
jgi:hypothetical protein